MSNLFINKTAVEPRIDIPGFNGKYYVTADGEVWGLRRGWKNFHRFKGHKKGRVREFHLVGEENHVVTMGKIMRETYFKGKVPEGYVLMHVNGLEEDWSVWNLRPIDQRELGRISYRKRTAKSVMKCDADTGEVVSIYVSAHDAARKNHCSHAAMLYACNKQAKKRPGIGPDGYLYRWEK